MTFFLLPTVILGFCVLCTGHSALNVVLDHVAVIAMLYMYYKYYVDKCRTSAYDSDSIKSEDSLYSSDSESDSEQSSASSSTNSSNLDDTSVDVVEDDEESRHTPDVDVTSFPINVRGFTVHTQQGLDRINDWYTWLDEESPEEPQPHFSKINAQTPPQSSATHITVATRHSLENLLFKVYNDNFMWDLLELDPRKDTMEPRLNPIVDHWQELVRKLFIEIVRFDLWVVGNIAQKQHKYSYVVNTLIPVLLNYPDIYTSPQLFKFGTHNQFMKAVLKKMIEFVNDHGMLESLLVISSIFPQLVRDDCHPRITADASCRTSVFVMQQHKDFARLIGKIPPALLQRFEL
jgi:hypothetical protein